MDGCFSLFLNVFTWKNYMLATLYRSLVWGIFFGGYSGARSYYDTASDPVSSWHDTRRASKVGRRESGAQPSAELAGRTPAVHQRAYQPHQCTPLNQNHAHTVEPHLSQTWETPLAKPTPSGWSNMGQKIGVERDNCLNQNVFGDYFFKLYLFIYLFIIFPNFTKTRGCLNTVFEPLSEPWM